MKIIKHIVAFGLFVFSFLLILWFMLTQPFVFASVNDISVSVSAERLKEHVIKLSSELPIRDLDADHLDVTAKYIQAQFEKYGKVEVMEYRVWGVPYKNVSVFFGPETKERIVIGAHYDSFDGLPGADDNASGVAGILELARLLKDRKLDKQVELIAYTLEEPPSFRTDDMGSAVHAKKLREENIQVDLMLSLEMIGYFHDGQDSQDYPIPLLNYFYPSRGNYIAVVSNFSEVGNVRKIKQHMRSVTELPVYSINAPALLPGIDFSDHLNFWKNDYPGVMITDTAFYRNKAYHTDEDTWERLDYSRMAEVVKGVYAVVLDYARVDH